MIVYSFIAKADYEMVSIFALLGTEKVADETKITTTGYVKYTSYGVYLYPYAIDAENSDFSREVYLVLDIKQLMLVKQHCREGYALIKGVFFNDTNNRVYGQIGHISSIETLPIQNKQQSNSKSCLEQ